MIAEDPLDYTNLEARFVVPDLQFVSFIDLRIYKIWT
jgi:hypothetical protein